MSFKKDYAFGKQKEIEILDTINAKFKDNIKLVKAAYSCYDFQGDKRIYELKSRNNVYKAFPTTLIPANKIIPKQKIIFLFYFIDGLYYIRYRKELFNTFECKLFVRNKRIDYNDKPQFYYHIPIEHLKKIDMISNPPKLALI